MPDYFIQFSCLLDVGTAENVSAAETIRGELAAELDRHEGVSLGFDMDVHHESGPGALWIRSDEYGEPEHVIRFVLRCAERLNLEGVWGFTWSHSCSKPRLDAFGGGAHVIDLGTRATIDDIDYSSFLAERISSPGAALAAKTSP